MVGYYILTQVYDVVLFQPTWILGSTSSSSGDSESSSDLFPFSELSILNEGAERGRRLETKRIPLRAAYVAHFMLALAYSLPQHSRSSLSH